MKQSRLFLSAVLALVLGLASWASADTGLDDEAIRAAVEKKLDKKDIKNGGGPWVAVENGTVTLQGKVKSIWAKNEAVKLAMDVDDVAAVQDELEISFGESDEKVTEEIAKKVRSYPFYTVYDDVNLAIHEGHVVLEGRVTLGFKSEGIEERVSKVLGVQKRTKQHQDAFCQHSRSATACIAYAADLRGSSLSNIRLSLPAPHSYRRGRRQCRSDGRGPFQSREGHGGDYRSLDVRRFQSGESAASGRLMKSVFVRGEYRKVLPFSIAPGWSRTVREPGLARA